MTRNDYLTHDPDIRKALSLVNDGTAYFSRTLDALPDNHHSGASLLPGWTRGHVIAHVAFNAKALMRLAEWAATGDEKQMYESSEGRDAEIEKGAVLPAAQLRALFRETANALDAAWRDLSDEAWHNQVRMAKGPKFPAMTTIWLRTREVWLHGVDLDSGASFDDFPPSLVDHLLANVLSSWRSRQAAEGIPNFVLTPTDRGVPKGVGALDTPDAVPLRGTAVDLIRWATGRGFLGITADSDAPVPAAPRWI
ncbi:MAG: maleylpyruvate isomerase family mycothiol-dependent enzyme [Microbacteriaceae bacterium]|nr:maleylpyruvate isomerase family mycothiol-dependent enzyme [Microbacteriaceae bacterium]